MRLKRRKIKNKIKKTASKKILKKKLSVLKKKKLSVLKKKATLRVAKAKEKTRIFANLQNLRDAVERLPEMPLPGAPVELPKDLPELNPVMEPALLPESLPEVKSAFLEIAQEKLETKKVNARQRNLENARETHKGTGIGVWVAVAATFSVILGVWAAMIGGIISSPVSEISFDDDLKTLKDEWENTTENIKDLLQNMNTRLETVQAEEGVKPGSDLLRAVGARVIFEATRGASGTVTSAP